MDPSFSENRNFFGVRETCRSQLSHFENSWRPNPNFRAALFGPFFEVPVTSFARPSDRKITGLVRVYATPETKCWLLATFCSRILLIWQSGSVIFRKSQLFSGSERLAVLNFHTLKSLHIGCSLALRARGRARHESLHTPLHGLVRFLHGLQGSRIFHAVRKGGWVWLMRERSLNASTHPCFHCPSSSLIQPPKSRASSFAPCEHHFWALFRGPRHK